MIVNFAIALGLGVFLPCIIGVLLIDILDGIGDLFRS